MGYRAEDIKGKPRHLLRAVCHIGEYGRHWEQVRNGEFLAHLYPLGWNGGRVLGPASLQSRRRQPLEKSTVS